MPACLARVCVVLGLSVRLLTQVTGKCVAAMQALWLHFVLLHRWCKPLAGKQGTSQHSHAGDFSDLLSDA